LGADLIIRARHLLPVSAPPVENGAVLVVGGKIAATGRWADISSTAQAPVADLGDVVILPGLVNAHCHLDYTVLAGQIPPQRTFPDWIQLMLAARSGFIYTDYAESWLKGARQLLESGVTTVSDIESAPELPPDVLGATPLRVASMIEMTCVRSRREPRAIVGEASAAARSFPDREIPHGLSPHALYSTTPEMLALVAEESASSNLPLAMHVAESVDEFEMYRDGSGALFDWLKGQRDMSDTGHGSPVQAVERSGLFSRSFLAVHVNYLAEGDAALLARRGVSVAHCPRSHDYFRHRAFPAEELADAGVNVCLGTDSLATVLKPRGREIALDMFEEMRAFADARFGQRPETIVRMATVNGAAALGQSGRLGELREGAWADLIAVPWPGGTVDPWDAVLRHTGPVKASMIGGHWVLGPAL
jgi:cytosine/adenosine deaminase-related metal-dependent hydrolase